MKAILVGCIGLLLGCSTFETPPPARYRNKVTIIVVENKNLPQNSRYIQQGSSMSFKDSDVCVIQLRNYPEYLGHEVRHCLEGNWHEGRKNGEDF